MDRDAILKWTAENYKKTISRYGAVDLMQEAILQFMMSNRMFKFSLKDSGLVNPDNSEAYTHMEVAVSGQSIVVYTSEDDSEGVYFDELTESEALSVFNYIVAKAAEYKN